MHEVELRTNAFRLRLVFSDLRLTRIAVGDPNTGELTPSD